MPASRPPLGSTQALETAQARHAALERSREELARARHLEAVGRLTGGVAHDFNNLLTVISGNLGLILGGPGISSRIERLARGAMTATERGANITQQLLTFARRQVNRPETVNSNRLVADFEPLLRRAVGERLKLVLNLSPVLDPARIDPAQFEGAILNLVVNARDATAGGGRITIDTRNVELDGAYSAKDSEEAAGPYVTVSVSDTGAGMTPDEGLAPAINLKFSS